MTSHISTSSKDALAYRNLSASGTTQVSARQGNVIIGKPEEAKYGLTHEQIMEAYPKAAEMGAKRFGLHTMVASNELDPSYFVKLHGCC